jgi:streptogramin lyase
MDKRAFLAGGLALGVASAPAAWATRGDAAKQAPAPSLSLRREGVPHRTARTVNIFRTRQGWPNGMALAPEGVWIGEQQTTTPDFGPAGVSNDAFLYDWSGRVLRTFPTRSKNTSGFGFGGGYLWVGANAAPNGVFQMSPEGETVSHRQIPLGGGGCHGVEWNAGKLWIVSTRLRAIMRVDPDTWQAEFMIPIQAQRSHETAYDNGAIWIVAGTGGGAQNRAGLHKYDAATGRLLETVDFVDGSADPHGLLIREGVLYSCDAGVSSERMFSAAVRRATCGG